MRRLPAPEPPGTRERPGQQNRDAQSGPQASKSSSEDTPQPVALSPLDSGYVYAAQVRLPRGPDDRGRTYTVRRVFFKAPSGAVARVQWHRSEGHEARLLRYRISDPEVLDGWSREVGE